MKDAMRKFAAAAVFLLCAGILLSGPIALIRSCQGQGAGFIGATTNTENATGSTRRLNEIAAPTGPVAMNSQKLTGLANGTAAGEAVNWTQTGQATSAIDLMLHGDGSDGALSASSGTTTLTRDTYYSSITLTGTARIDTAGFRLFCSGTTDLTGMPADTIFRGFGIAAGAGAAGGTGGTAGGTVEADGITVVGTASFGTAGGAGGTTTGSQATAPTNRTGSSGGASAAGGKGGTGASGSGGASRGGATTTRDGGNLPHRLDPLAVFGRSVNISTTGSWLAPTGGAGGPGGSGGGGDGTAGGGGGGGGQGGRGLFFSTKTLIVTGASACVVSSKGQNGANGGTPAAGNRGGGGGGSGGGGGFAYAVAGSTTGSLSGGLCVDGGAGGNGGNGTGTGIGGDGGGGGSGGYAWFANLAAGTLVSALGVAGSAGTAGSGTTGGAGASGEAVRVNF
jgi:hypothetical protein